MKYLLSIIIIISFLAGGCNKVDKQPSLLSDCATAEHSFACYLDRALATKDINLCNQVAIPRVTCLTAYYEIMETSLSCQELIDPQFKQECEEYKERESANMPESIDSAPGLIIDAFGRD